RKRGEPEPGGARSNEGYDPDGRARRVAQRRRRRGDLFLRSVQEAEAVMKLYVWGVAPNPRRVQIYLAEKGLKVPTEDAGTPNEPTLKAEFLQSGPHRRVPLLVLDDGTQIGEAMAICRYFETLHPEPPLMGGDALERATIEMWERSADNDGMNAVAE